MRRGGLAIIVAWLAGCGTAPVHMADNKLEPSLRTMIGISEADLAAIRRQESFTIHELYLLAADYSGRLPLESENIYQAQSQERTAYGAWLPRISVRASQTFPTISTPGAGGSGVVFPGIRVLARQPVFTGLQEYTGIRTADLNIRIAKHNLRFVALQLYAAVAEAALTIHTLERNRERTREIRDLAKDALAETRRRVALGRNRRTDRLRSEAQLARIEAQLQGLEETIYAARQQLVLLTGVPENIAIRITASEIPISDINMSDNFLNKRPDTDIAILNEKVASFQVDLADGGNLPSVFLDGTYRVPQENQPNTRSDFFGALTVEVPLVNGLQPYENQKIARSRLRQAQITREETIRRARAEIRTLYQEYRNNQLEAAAYERALAAAEENYRALAGEYRLNLANALEVITALQDLQNARTESETAQWAVETSAVRLTLACGLIPGEKE